MKRFFKKIRFYFRFLRSFGEKHQKLIVVGFLIGIFTFLFFPKILKVLVYQKAQKIGIVGKFSQSDLPLEIQQQLSEGLTTVAPDGQVKPQIAESWEIQNDGKIYIFTLKDNLFWQDGKPILAKDINYNFSDVTTTPLDSKRVKFELKEPFVPFPAVVSKPIFKKGLMGNGEYKVTKIKKRGEVVEKLYLVPVKKMSLKTTPEIIYRFYPSEETVRIAFKLGEIDVIRGITSPEQFTSWKRVKITPKIKFNRFVAIFFNTQDSRFADKSVRQALAYAINKRWQPRALSSIDPRSWAYNSKVKAYDLDFENAKNLLEKADEDKEIELSTIPSLLEVAEEIKKDWQQLGINTKIRVINSLQEPFQALLLAQEIPFDPDQYIFWHSTQELNISRFKSPKIDKLLEDGRKTFDSEKRKEIYQEFQKSLVEDSPAIFLYHPTLYTLSRI